MDCNGLTRHSSNVLVLALSKRNTNAAEVILFLHRLVQVLIEYFKELEEESIRDNFVIIYELLDEMMDFGFPQTTESKILQECVCFDAVEKLRKPNTRLSGILRRSHTSLKLRSVRQWLSPTLCPGGRRVYGIARTRSF